MKLLIFHLLVLICLWIIPSSTNAQRSITAKVDYKNQSFYGWPLGWDGKRIAILGPAGKLNFVPVKSRDDMKFLSEGFQPYSADQIRSLLQNEFASRYDISTNGNYVVVHPWGAPAIWAKPFEVLHQRFVDFFEANSVELQKPAIPLVAVVLRSRNDFDRYLINEVEVHDSRIAGYYSRLTNRITTYDPAGQLRVGNDRWLYNASPIIHEATHQSAFNTGVHNRFAPPPKWLSEGLATLFEAKGFHHASKFKNFRNRINPVRLKQLRKHLAKGSINAALINLIANDKIFQSNTELAYALSWGLSFYLYETQSAKYFDFLASDAKRKDFAPYVSSQRLQDFAKAFGNDFEKLEKSLVNYYTQKQLERENR